MDKSKFLFPNPLKFTTCVEIFSICLLASSVPSRTFSSFKKLPHRSHFRAKLFRSGLAALVILSFSLIMGTLGYMYWFNLGWVDGIYNASMILAGMGPVNEASNDGGKLFASFYAIYSGVAFLSTAAVLLAPVLHRFLHKFQLDIEE